MITNSGLPLILHYGELYNYFIIYYYVIIIEIKCTINVKKESTNNKCQRGCEEKGTLGTTGGNVN